MFRFSIRELLLITVIVALGLVVSRDRLVAHRTRMGLDGFCPVTVVHSSVWKIGDPKFQAVFDNRRYLFIGEQEQQIFLGNPERYAPVCSGNDVVRLIDEKRVTEGLRSYGVAHRHRIYLFDSPETRNLFEASPGNYASAANARQSKSKY